MLMTELSLQSAAGTRMTSDLSLAFWLFTNT